MPIRTARLVPHRDGFQITEEDTTWSLWQRRLVAAVERPLGLAVAVAALLCLGAAVVNVGLRDAVAAGAAPFDGDNRMLRAIREPAPVSERTAPLSQRELGAALLRCDDGLFAAPKEVVAEPARVVAPRPIVRPAAALTSPALEWTLERRYPRWSEEVEVDERRRNLVVVVQASKAEDFARVGRALVKLAAAMKPSDRLTIVSDSDGAGIILPPTPGGDAEAVARALRCLSVRGDPALGSAVDLAFRSARASFITGAINRVIIIDDPFDDVPARREAVETGEVRRPTPRRRSAAIGHEKVILWPHWSGCLVGHSWPYAPRGRGRLNPVKRDEEVTPALLDSAGFNRLPVANRITMKMPEPEHPCVTWRRTPPHKRPKPTHSQTRATSYCP